jgi:large subunit ribosomal protein L18
MASSSRDTGIKRARRVRRRLKSLANGRPRLSVFRSAKNIYAQVIDDRLGVTLAAASSLEAKDAKGSDTRDRKGTEGRGLRSRRIHLSRARQGARGRGP